MYIFLLIVALMTERGYDRTRTMGPQEEVVSLCALVAQPSQYAGKTVTMQATLVSGMEFEIFKDDSCPSRANPNTGKSDVVEATFDKSQYDFKSKIHKKLAKLLKKKHQAQVTVIGLFVDPGHYFGHQGCCRYQLGIQKLVSVEELSKHP